MVRLIQIVCALGFAAVFLLLLGCDGEPERRIRIAEFQAKFTQTCMPGGDERILVEWRDDKLLCRLTPRGSFKPGKTPQPAIVASRDELPW